jgi:hypothetical protein
VPAADDFWDKLLLEYPNVPAALTPAQVDEIKERWAEWTSDKPVKKKNRIKKVGFGKDCCKFLPFLSGQFNILPTM